MAATTAPLCPSCGAPLEPGFRFCAMCGKPAHAARGIRLALVRNDGHPARIFTVEREEAICGRTEGDIRLPDDPTVSPRHARFTAAGGVVRVEDLGSVNGTFLRLREPRRLAVGDEVRIGRQLLRIEPLQRPARAEEHGVRPWGTKDPGCRRHRLAQLLEGGGLGEIFPLRDGENTVGREAGDVTFPSDGYVSARHARIVISDDGITIADAGSSNGTYAKVVGTTDLSPGDRLLVGAQLLRLE